MIQLFKEDSDIVILYFYILIIQTHNALCSLCNIYIYM